MKQVIPFVKDLEFGTRISEITSIALEHNLAMENDDSIVGDFTISGKYKINDISINEEVFEKKVSFDITLDDKYDASKVQIDIDDFYYEIINDEFLRVHIDVLANNLVYFKREEPEVLEIESDSVAEFSENEMRNEEIKENNDRDDFMINNEVATLNNTSDTMMTTNEENVIMTSDNRDQNIDLSSSFSSSFLDNEEKYVTYKVHIVRESETVETIKEKYNVTKEELEKYNDLENIILGTKLIIPLSNE